MNLVVVTISGGPAQPEFVVPCGGWIPPAIRCTHQRNTGKQGRTARYRRLCRGAGSNCKHIAAMPETLLLNQRYWLGRWSNYIITALIAGMATIMYEGRTRPDGGIWWSLVEKYKVTVMFRAHRCACAQAGPGLITIRLSSLRALFLAGEPLDEPTAQWISSSLKKPIIDNYWQTETGWPILSLCNGVEQADSKFGSPGKAVYGYNVKLLDDQTGEELTGANQKGVVAIEGPLPPGCMQTVWRDDERFVKTYWSSVPGRMVYSTFDWGIRDEWLLLHPGAYHDVIAWPDTVWDPRIEVSAIPIFPRWPWWGCDQQDELPPLPSSRMLRFSWTTTPQLARS